MEGGKDRKGEGNEVKGVWGLELRGRYSLELVDWWREGVWCQCKATMETLKRPW